MACAAFSSSARAVGGAEERRDDLPAPLSASSPATSEAAGAADREDGDERGQADEGERRRARR